MKQTLMTVLVAVVATGAVVLWAAPPVGTPRTISYRGNLELGGVAVQQPVAMRVMIFADATSPAILWEETLPSVPVNNGEFSVLLGTIDTTLDTVLSAQATPYLGLEV